ncbi:YeiH family protein [Helicobacter cholecystus]|uniref:YeiH family protein n=1 Tax=Helicobacter cholecystus TaxID=45498 RepID=A0A3D8IXK7_9HELI|nr:YeiH family protein [Helicobacter cholecystus]RDU69291.1 YeiH family protein [Helicobacter cholecystus]VEJ24369.1 Putative membrane protein YeiH [Helicobacter cholecystus]
MKHHHDHVKKGGVSYWLYHWGSIIKSNTKGLVFVGAIVLISMLLAGNKEVHDSTHLAATAFAILIGSALSPVFFKYQHPLQAGVHFSAKKLLRLGIILYGFNVTLTELASVGFWGILLSVIVIVAVFLISVIAGTKIFGLDKETSMLVGAGSAICGAAAVLALESSLKSDSFKGIIAVGTVVIFGLLCMFAYPIAYALGLIPGLDGNGMGVFMGATLHEVANVAGGAEMAKDMASNTFSQGAANIAIIVKMMRVIMLVPFLLIVTMLFAKEQEHEAQIDGRSHKKIQIPWFAFMFLGVIILNTYLAKISSFELIGSFSIADLVTVGKYLCTLSIVFSMAALGLQIDIKKFIQAGGKAFGLAFLLCLVLIFGGYFLTLAFKGILW